LKFPEEIPNEQSAMPKRETLPSPYLLELRDDGEILIFDFSLGSLCVGIFLLKRFVFLTSEGSNL